jgi:DNA-binding IclR family transcriptional regulator
MEQLGSQFHETINLAFFDEGEVIYVDKVESERTLRMDLAVGRRIPAYCTALGKVFLADLTQGQLTAYLRNRTLIPLTERTLTNPEKLRMNLDRVRRQGFAIDDRELDEGIRCIAAPIRDELGRVVAAMSVAGPSIRMTLARLESIRDPILKVTTDISQQLGYSLNDDKTPFGPTDESRLLKGKTSIPRLAK